MVDAVVSDSDAIRLNLLRGFELRQDDQLVDLPLSAQRVLAFLALHDRPLQRLYVAGSLWLDATEERANASLRTALWRLGRPSFPLVDASTTHLSLADAVEVDVRDARAAAEAVLAGAQDDTTHARDKLCRSGELLPDWYEDWVYLEREHFRQLRLHALEALCAEMASAGRFADAARAGLAAVDGEPLRESAHRVLIAVYLAEGNAADALRQYRFFRKLLDEQLGLAPSHLMDELMRGLPIHHDR